MRVVEHDPDRQPPSRVEPAAPAITFTPFATVPLGGRSELRMDIAQKGRSRALSVRLFKSGGRHRPLQPEHPWHLFPERLPAVIAALTKAAAALGAMPASSRGAERSAGTIEGIDPVPDHVRVVMEENSRQLDGITRTASY